MSTKIFQSQLELQNNSTLATPSAGYLILAPKTDNKVYLRTSAGVEERLLTTSDSLGGGAYLPLSGGTVTGLVTFESGADFKGDLVQFKNSCNVFYSRNYFPDIPVYTGCSIQLNLGLNEYNQLGIISSGGGTYTLPIASASVLGGVKVGSGLSINATTGVLCNAYTYTLPIATASVLGGIKVGSGLAINSITGVLCATASGGGGAYLPLSGGSMYNSTVVGNLNAYYLRGCSPTCFAPATHTHSYDNYEGWNIDVNSTSVGYIPSKNTGSGYAGGINFKAGEGICICNSSIIGNKLQLQFDADYSGLNIPISNLASQTTLSADCTLTVSSWTSVLNMSLPSAGTYLIQGKVFTTQSGNVSSFFRLAIGTTYYDYSVMPSESPTGTGTGTNTTNLIAVITVGSSSIVNLAGFTPNSGIVVKSSMTIGSTTAAGLTKLTYVRLS